MFRRGEEKIANVSSMAGGRSIDAPSMKAEIAKCDVVCANCHKKRTYKRSIKH